METVLTALVEGIVVPITSVIPFLASSGILLATFAGLWIAFGIALIRDPARIETAWRQLRRTPLVVQGLAWLLFLPVLAGAWIWRRTWPRVARLSLIAALAAWNLLVFLPASG